MIAYDQMQTPFPRVIHFAVIKVLSASASAVGHLYIQG